PLPAFLLAAITSFSCSSEHHAIGLPGDSALPIPSDFNVDNESVEHPRGEGDAGLTTTSPHTSEPVDAPSSDTAGNSSSPSASDETSSEPAPTGPSEPIVWERCGPGQCTTLQVPVD